VFAGGRLFSFWGGVMGVPAEVRKEFYMALGKKPEDVFPIRFTADPALCGGVARAEIAGFYKTKGKTVEVERG
jgi:hypothetical protein